MIDFRYHLVSLISVFLALAVGIILGAGPLQGTIGDQLTGQVDALRTERNDLRDSLTATQADADKRLQFIEAAGPTLIEGTLEGKRVAVVDLDDVTASVQEGVQAEVEAAGGTVAVSARVTPSWTDEDHAGFRDTVASGMRPRLRSIVTDLPEDAPTEQLLSTALAVALTHQAAPGFRSEDATALERQLIQADLITVDAEQTQPADAVVLLSGGGGASTGSDKDASPAPAETAMTSLVTLAGTVQTVAPVVVAGPTPTAGDVVSAVRGDNAVADQVTTVSGVESQVGQIVVPLAVAAHLTGTNGHYGSDDGSTPLPPIVRPTDSTDGRQPADQGGKG
ncbi:copper transporter [Xylanimonas sp. McL0601]|uniref:copper transporter n=1 Tax=Xylanimonas sp. McL0601 TaxID=3414739 RepID=UPI003CEFF6B5